jgi:hypothetical protein
MKLGTGGFYQPLLDIPRQPTCMKKVACLYCLCRPIIPILYKSLQHCVRRVLFTLSTVWPTVPRISWETKEQEGIQRLQQIRRLLSGRRRQQRWRRYVRSRDHHMMSCDHVTRSSHDVTWSTGSSNETDSPEYYDEDDGIEDQVLSEFIAFILLKTRDNKNFIA